MKVYIERNNKSITLGFENPYIIEDGALAEAVNTICGTDIAHIANLFWEGDFMNDCYKLLRFRDGDSPNFEKIYEDCEYDEEELERIKVYNTVIGFLDDYIPKDYHYDYILVDVSW